MTRTYTLKRRAERKAETRQRIVEAAIYDWYERNIELVASVLRDAEYHTLTREITELRFRPYMRTYQEVLGESLNIRQRAMLQLALSFFTWRTLVCNCGLKQNAAVEAMVQAINTNQT